MHGRFILSSYGIFYMHYVIATTKIDMLCIARYNVKHQRSTTVRRRALSFLNKLLKVVVPLFAKAIFIFYGVGLSLPWTMDIIRAFSEVCKHTFSIRPLRVVVCKQSSIVTSYFVTACDYSFAL